jgi:hypothetical protein
MRESAMSEFEFDRLLDAVQAAIAPAPQEEFLTHQVTSPQPARAANDNETVWDFIPFPEGWFAAC